MGVHSQPSLGFIGSLSSLCLEEKVPVGRECALYIFLALSTAMSISCCLPFIEQPDK